MPVWTLGTYGISTIRCWYSETICWICSTISLYDARRISQIHFTPHTVLQMTGGWGNAVRSCGCNVGGETEGTPCCFLGMKLEMEGKHYIRLDIWPKTLPNRNPSSKNDQWSPQDDGELRSQSAKRERNICYSENQFKLVTANIIV
jgi:hypothetical protein